MITYDFPCFASFLLVEISCVISCCYKVIAKRVIIKLKLRIIPNEVLDKQAVERKDIRFFELAHFKVDVKVSGKKVTV